MYRHILIATDGSQVAQRGLDHGLSLAKALGARVTIVMATDRFPAYVGMAGWSPAVDEMPAWDARQAKLARDILQSASSDADKLGVPADTVHVPDSLAADAILATADAAHCSLIVMASHGRRGLERVLLGSQTSEVLARSRLPILVVR